MREKNEQELFWMGDFGNEYIERNKDYNHVASNIALFSTVLRRTNNIGKILEFGPNIGLNLKALHTLLPKAALTGVEINAKAAAILQENLPFATVHNASILDFEPQEQWDFTMVKGVLIHLNPEALPEIYNKLYTLSSKYVFIAEYYNPTPMEVPYRGNKDRLFKRDFAGEMLDTYPDLKLVDYGFIYRRDYNFPNDDITWFLMEKQ